MVIIITISFFTNRIIMSNLINTDDDTNSQIGLECPLLTNESVAEANNHVRTSM